MQPGKVNLEQTYCNGYDYCLAFLFVMLTVMLKLLCFMPFPGVPDPFDIQDLEDNNNDNNNNRILVAD